MTYTLKFLPRYQLWELKINRFRTRFYVCLYEAEKLVARYRQMLQAESDRYDRLRS
jgi:hypothetical protein